MTHVNTHEAKTKLSSLLSQVELNHEEIKICRNGKPIAILSPVSTKPDPLVQHPEIMGITFNEDPMEPLSQTDWPEDYR